MNALLFEYGALISWAILVKDFDMISFPNTLTFIHAIHSYKN